MLTRYCFDVWGDFLNMYIVLIAVWEWSEFTQSNMTATGHSSYEHLKNRSPKLSQLNFKFYLILLVLLETTYVTNGYHDGYPSNKPPKEAMVCGSVVLVPSGSLLDVQNPRIHPDPTEPEYISLPYVYVLIRVCGALMNKICYIFKSLRSFL